MNDLYMTEILPQMITLTEAYIQIYKRRVTIDCEESEKMAESSGWLMISEDVLNKANRL